MRVNSVQNQPVFQAKVDDKFVNAVRGFINSGENRLKNNYKLNKKLEDVSKFGYDNYTVKMEKTVKSTGNEYVLKAVKDGRDFEDGAFLGQRYSFRKIAELFLKLSRGDLKRAISKQS